MGKVKANPVFEQARWADQLDDQRRSRSEKCRFARWRSVAGNPAMSSRRSVPSQDYLNKNDIKTLPAERKMPELGRIDVATRWLPNPRGRLTGRPKSATVQRTGAFAAAEARRAPRSMEKELKPTARTACWRCARPRPAPRISPRRCPVRRLPGRPMFHTRNRSPR